MEVSTSPIRQESPSAQMARFVHEMSFHVPRWHPIDTVHHGSVGRKGFVQSVS